MTKEQLIELEDDYMAGFVEFCINRFYGEQIHSSLIKNALRDYEAAHEI